MAAERYIGLMSGTSMDGVDAVLLEIGGTADRVRLLAHHHLPFEPALKDLLMGLNSPQHNEVHRAALAANALSRSYAEAVDALLKSTRSDPGSITALGAHGQTVRHRPGEFDGVGYTVQLLNGALLAERTAIDVVCDFRTRDLAAGGQGAPLVPAFHQAVFGGTHRQTAVLNLGGIANLTLLDPHLPVRGFDCGPGNALLDLWCQRHQGAPYDAEGQWSACGAVDADLLTILLTEPFFARRPPKSTGRDLFNEPWLNAALARSERSAKLPAQDVQATLCELTAASCANALLQHQPQTQELLLCGGGALNADLCRRLAQRLPGVAIHSTAHRGISPMQVEAAAFGWLAARHVHRQPGNCPDVTGTTGPRILGCLYPA